MLTYDAVALQGGADLFVEWMPKLHPDLEFGPAALDEGCAVIEWPERLGDDSAAWFQRHVPMERRD